MRQIAIYGKGGIGKSTLTANLSAALADDGRRVLQIGCDPKHDSTKLLLGGTSQRTVLELLKEHGEGALGRDDIVLVGYGGIACVEAGGPEPGVGCAGRGILSMAKTLDAVGLDRGGYDVVAYDVLGDVVCGGFSVPMRADYADEVYIVSSGEIMSLYAANNIARGLLRFEGKLAGIIGNAREVPHEEELLGRLAEALGTDLIAFFPRDERFRDAELHRRTVVEHAPGSDLAERFRTLARRVVTGGSPVTPTPLDEHAFEELIFDVAGGERPRAQAPAVLHERAVEAPPPRERFARYLDRGSPAAADRYPSKAVRQRAPLYSCALAGAFTVVGHVGDALTVMHSPSGCAYPSLDAAFLTERGATLRGLDAAPGSALPRLLCTDLAEADAVFGGEGKLERVIRDAVARHAPRAVFVITSCPSAIVGDDPHAVAARAADLAVPIVPLGTDGIMGGDFAQGQINAYQALVDAFVLAHDEPAARPDLINLVGEEPIGNRADEDLARLLPCLQAMGLKVNTRFVHASSIEALRRFRRAPVSVRLSDAHPARMAQEILGDRAGARFVDVGPPVGFAATHRFLEALAQATNRQLPADLLAAAAAEHARLVGPLRAALTGKRLVVGGYVADIGWVAELADELGFVVAGVAVLDSAMNPDATSDGDIPRYAVADAGELLEVTADLAPDLLLANYLPRDLPVHQRAAALPLQPPLGFTGGLLEAAGWVRALRRGAEGWRADRPLVADVAS